MSIYISILGHFILPCILFAENYFVAEIMLIGSIFMLVVVLGLLGNEAHVKSYWLLSSAR